MFLALGSNQGDRAATLRAAYGRLRELLGEAVASGIYETEPMYVADQPRFLNAVCAWTTSLEPFELLGRPQAIERELGRRRSVPKGPRAIDIDSLLYGERRVAEPGLLVPHPGIHERAFVLAPLLEIAPELRDPVSGLPYRLSLDTVGLAGVSYVEPLDR